MLGHVYSRMVFVQQYFTLLHTPQHIKDDQEHIDNTLDRQEGKKTYAVRICLGVNFLSVTQSSETHSENPYV